MTPFKLPNQMDLTPDVVGKTLNPLIDRVATRVQQTSASMATDAERVVRTAGAELRDTNAVVQMQVQNTVFDLGRQGQRLIHEARFSSSEVLEQANAVLHDRIDQWNEGHRKFANEIMAKVLVVGLVGLALYGASFAKLSPFFGDGPAAVITYFWMAVTFLGVLVTLTGKLTEPLDYHHVILHWLMMVAVFGGLGVIVLQTLSFL